jgi:hypothetical protein
LPPEFLKLYKFGKVLSKKITPLKSRNDSEFHNPLPEFEKSIFLPPGPLSEQGIEGATNQPGTDIEKT